MITRADVEHAAKLARIRLGDDEVDAIARDLERIVGHVDALMKVDVERVEPMTHPGDVQPRRRDDVVDEHVLGRQALAGSAGFDDDTGLVRVPKVIESIE